MLHLVLHMTPSNGRTWSFLVAIEISWKTIIVFSTLSRRQLFPERPSQQGQSNGFLIKEALRSSRFILLFPVWILSSATVSAANLAGYWSSKIAVEVSVFSRLTKEKKSIVCCFAREKFRLIFRSFIIGLCFTSKIDK